MFALSWVLNPDVMSSLLSLIGAHTQTLILYADWLKITIRSLWSGVTHSVTPTRSRNS